MILSGDIGGTNTRLGLFRLTGERLQPFVQQTYPSPRYSGLTEIVREFLAENKAAIDCACFGVACPVRDGRCVMPNLSWVVDSSRLSSELSIERVEIMNDLEANAHGISVLEPGDFRVINEGKREPDGNRALLSAGTGFGVAGLARYGGQYLPFSSEGGHTDFASRNRLEADLLFYLLEHYPHVSYERVISGPGLYNIYQFLRDTERAEEPDWLGESISQGDPPAVITRAALDGRSELCDHTLDLFVSIFGAKAGNVALEFMATGGLFIGGGIAPKIIEKLEESTFMDAFVAKGRMESLLKLIPIRVIMNDKTALLGAARYAAMRFSGK